MKVKATNLYKQHSNSNPWKRKEDLVGFYWLLLWLV